MAFAGENCERQYTGSPFLNNLVCFHQGQADGSQAILVELVCQIDVDIHGHSKKKLSGSS
jgi:hypothetical protein